MMRWLLHLLRLQRALPTSITALPIFYVVVENPGTENLAHEATRSIHRARGICREMAAKDKQVAIATYTAITISRDY